jgi:hypothetical protein
MQPWIVGSPFALGLPGKLPLILIAARRVPSFATAD